MIEKGAWLVLVSALALGGCKEHATVAAPAAPAETATADTRTPVPLLPMMAEHQKAEMREHLATVQAIVAALAKDDFAGVAKAAQAIGYSDEEAQECRHLGAGAPGFFQVALDFHRAADGIGAAAQKKDRAAVLAALDATLSRCVGCHAAFRQQVVDQATWTRLTAGHQP